MADTNSSGDDPGDTRTGLFGRRLPRSPSESLLPDAPPPPPPPPRRRPFVTFLSGFLSLALILGGLAALAVYVGEKQFTAPGPLQADKVLVVRGGSTDVAEQLQREGIIDSPMMFVASLYALGKSSQIKAGEYLFKQNASISDVIDTLVEGKAILHAVTIPEGLTSLQIVERLRENDVLVGDIVDVPREGTLLPDTYKFQRGMTRTQLLERMAQEHARVLKEVWARRAPDLPIKSPQDLVILASIVEKETGRADERTRVAGVFVNRLNKQMKLQSDPTIVYGLVGGKGSLGRGILRSEIEQPTPYNTYVVQGLPPGPIANPGRAAMEAVASPSRTKELFFVADGTGGHVFAETLDQHNKNVARWRQVEAERATATAGPAVPATSGAVTPAGPAAAPGGKPTTSTGAPLGPRGNLDAVAGTPKDPLKNKTFDLNNPKTVPPLRP
jgi:UPF0755 protein